ncbi:MAG: ParB N-terminal domain-containing protein [Chloroflexota bacterium]
MASKAKPDFTGSVNERAADAIFGAPATPPAPPSSPNVIARPVSIFEIVPDAKQPRRQIPSTVRQHWNGDTQTLSDMFVAWVELFAEESGRTFDDIETFINQVLAGEEVSPAEVYTGEVADSKRNWGVIGGSLMAVVNLAAEIRRDGLTNPITVVRVGNQFLIETGERRWLAFHLLHIFLGVSSNAWTTIPAREVKESSVWRQASENTAREQLNAISMARQLAILLMDLISDEDFLTFDEVVEGFPCDRAYYAQVSDGNRYRIPRGKGEQLVNAMGVKNPEMLRRYRDLLRLPDEIWMLADDLDWEEGFIRTRVAEFSPIESLQIAKARMLAEEVGYRVTEVGHTVPHGTVSNQVEGEPDQEAAMLGEEEAIFGDETDRPDAPTDKDDEPTVDPTLEYWAISVLEHAHKCARDGKPWFAAKDSPSGVDRLNQLIERHLLRGRTAYTNTYFDAAFYAISGQGCAAIGKPYIATPLPEHKPVSGGEFHAGNGAAPDGTPPKDDPAAEQRKREQAEKRAVDIIVVFPELITAAMRKLYTKDFQTAESRAQATRALDASIELLKSIRQNINPE